MVMQKRLGYGFNGYQVPPIPRATRSARKRSICRSKADGNKMCAFDLLATVAGNLLLGSDNSNISADTYDNKEQSASLKDSFKKEENNIDEPLNAELSDQGNCKNSLFVSGLAKQASVLNKEPPHALVDACSGPASVITTSDSSVKVGSPEQVVGDVSKVLLGSSTRIAGGESSVSNLSASCKLEGESKTQIKTKSFNYRNMSIRNRADMSNSDCLVTGNRNPSALVSSDLSVKFPLGRDHNSSCSFPLNREDVKLGTRDDDENSGCTQPSAANKAFRSCNQDRRIKNMMSSDSCKVNSTMKDDEDSNADVDTRYLSHKKSGNKPQRSLRDYPLKKRKLYNCSSISNPDKGRDGGLYGSPWKGPCGDGAASVGTLPRVTGPSTSAAVEHASRQTRDSYVKLKIKSFQVPELFIEIPETATVGSLKRTVMEAVTAVLGGGLHVGVLVQDKKIRDDDRTLLQTGISHNYKQDALGFVLEPISSPAPLSMCSGRHPSLLPCESPKALARYSAVGPSLVLNSEQLGTSDTVTDAPGSNFSNFVESDHDSAPSPPDMSQEKSAADSRALVALPSKNAEALSMVPMRKPKRSESAQRRIRRPFSVTEVEALVQAVEKLGTGRWRDVKLRAFDNAKHRTYVDLKDKWKTLVHTARISPQQRRGEPVPQELLDRVLMAHAYWNQQQTKQHSEACLLL